MTDITEKEILRFFEEDAGRPLSTREVISYLNIQSTHRSVLRKLLRQMSKDGLLIKLKKGRYSLPSKMKLVTGKVQGHPDGFGFLLPDEEGVPDLFLSPRKMKEAMHGDKVICRMERTDGRKAEGSVVRIVERGQKTVVGVFDRTIHFAYVIPTEKRIGWDIPIPKKHTMGAKKGQAVVVEITRYPTKSLPPEGKILEVLGRPDDPEIELELIIRKNGLPVCFPKEVAVEAQKIATEIPSEEMERRMDLRGQNIFTIDGETAKDFDDAISIAKKPNGGYTLGVHIADVSYYVSPGSMLDKEALERGTSVYFPDRVIPMLPEELSNGICSLKPNVERLTLSCYMEFDANGIRQDFKLEDTIIKSAARLTYTEVAKILESDEKKSSSQDLKKLREKLGKTWEDLFIAKELALLLNKNRLQNGSVDFDLPESDIVLNMEGKIENIVETERNIAHRLIEEFMLSANICVAEALQEKCKETIFRVHESPNPEKLATLKEFAHNFGYSFPKAKEFDAKDLQSILSQAQGKVEEKLINHVALKSMKQAEYSTENIGHFCLAFDCYTHFTSPIRRYPDLVVHRQIRSLNKSADNEKKSQKVTIKPLSEVAKQASILGRRAEESEREVIKFKKAQFMMDKIGETYNGFICGVNSFGFFVELADLFVEGLVHVSSLSDDYYVYQEKQHSLVGERKRRTFQLCDQVRVKVVDVNLERVRVDFQLVG